MTIDIIRRQELELALIVYKGVVGFKEYLGAMREYGSGGLARLELVDLRQAELEGFSNQNLWDYVHMTERAEQKRPEEAKVALVAGAPHTFGTGRMFQSLSESMGFKPIYRVFDNINEALAWLGLKDQDPASLGLEP